MKNEEKIKKEKSFRKNERIIYYLADRIKSSVIFQYFLQSLTGKKYAALYST